TCTLITISANSVCKRSAYGRHWHTAVRDITHGRGVDQVIDTGGGTLEQSIQSVALDGQVNFIGRLSDPSTTIDMNGSGCVPVLRIRCGVRKVVITHQDRT